MSARLKPRNDELFYDAMIRRDPDFAGVFIVGVRTTGVFCRPGCPARLPMRDNCEFFASAAEAEAAGYRACLRCRPQLPPDAETALVRRLTEAVEREPERRWDDADLAALGVRAETARRQFRKRFGMTFSQYARAKRVGTALHDIRNGKRVTEAQFQAGYESASGFREAFARVVGAAPSVRSNRALSASWFDTPLGPMIAVGDERALHAVEYADHEALDRQIARIERRANAGIVPGRSAPVRQVETELAEYFRGERREFSTPLHRNGTAFQDAVWDALLAIPLGETRSYGDIARAIGKPRALRACAQANGANPFAIVIPCHRVINTGGKAGGYGGGLPRKLWLLEHEQRMIGGIENFALR